MAKRRILQIDGGGIKGIMPAAVCMTLEAKLGKPCNQIFNLMSGTSTGAIISGMLAAGVPAKTIYNLYTERGAELFRKNPWYKRIFGPKYSRSSLIETMRRMVKLYGHGSKLGDVRCDLISTTFNGCTGRTHFQMSWDEDHKDLDLVEVISWSALSAVHYFGPICKKDYKYKIWYQQPRPHRTYGAVFFDGGQGRNNCTLSECVVTALKKGWLGKESVDILSLGCGAPKLFTPYRDESDKGKVSRIKDYVNQSRLEAVHDQLSRAKAVEKHIDNLNIFRMDAVLQPEEDSLDALDFIPKFMEYGEEMVKDIPAEFLNL